MRRRLEIFALLSAIVAVATAAALAPVARAAQRFEPGEALVRFEPGEALVRFEPGTTPAQRAAIRDRTDVTLANVLELPRTQLVRFGGSVRSAVARLEQAPNVLDAQPNYRYQASASPPDDSFFDQQWGLTATPGVNALPAWDRGRGGGQLIAVLDTGIDLTHPDLVASLWANPGEIAGNGLDDDGNGRDDDVNGYDFVSGDAHPDDFNFHGTHVAGIAAAEAGNEQGVAGVAPEAELMAVRVLDGDGIGSTDAIAEGVTYAVDEGAGVINMSLGGRAGGPDDPIFSQAIDHAGQANAVVVVAAGNESADNDSPGGATVPCTFPAANLICVAALNTAGGLAGYSSFGLQSVDVAAPGSGVLSSKTDWAPPLFSEGFESGLGAWTHPPGTTAWGAGTPGAGGTGKAASDSAGDYAPGADARLTKAVALLLDGRGCRVHFDLKSDVAAGDELFAGALTGDPTAWDGLPILDQSSDFQLTEVSISDLDGRSDVYPTFELSSNLETQADGAYVDNVRVLCRDESYGDSVVVADGYAEPDAGSYMRLGGTSMATPHVSGVAALVRAADPGIAAADVVDAIASGGRHSVALATKIRTGRQVDALGAIQAALSAGETPQTPQTPAGGTQDTDTNPEKATRPGPAGFATRFRVGRRGRLAIRVAGDRRVRGLLRLRAGARRAVILRSSFRTSSRGRALVRVRLNRTGRRLLTRSAGRLRARMSVVLTNAAGLRSVTTGRVLLRR